MVKAAPAAMSSGEFYDRVRARLSFDVPAGLIDPNIIPETGDPGTDRMAKYLALGEAGIATTDRRLAIVRLKTRPTEKHLVVIVRDGDRWLILDNRTNALVDSTAAHPYQPLQELDANGVRDFEPVSQVVAAFRPAPVRSASE